MDLPFADEPLASAVLYASGKYGEEIELKFRSGREATITTSGLVLVTDGHVKVGMSSYDDLYVQSDYQAADLRLRRCRVGLDMTDLDADDEAECRARVDAWIAGRGIRELSVSDAEIHLGSGPAT
jgi:hypothetical protein